MCIDKKELQGYKALNNLARKNSVVILGSTYMKEMPVGELRQIFGIMSDIYNRSLSNLSVSEAKEVATSIMKELIPKRLVLHLGETDLENDNLSVDETIDRINEITNEIKKIDKHIKIVFVSLNNLSNKEIENEFNLKLEKLAQKNKCTYADITSAPKDDTNKIHAFRLLKYFMTDDFSFRIM